MVLCMVACGVTPTVPYVRESPVRPWSHTIAEQMANAYEADKILTVVNPTHGPVVVTVSCPGPVDWPQENFSIRLSARETWRGFIRLEWIWEWEEACWVQSWAVSLK